VMTADLYDPGRPSGCSTYSRDRVPQACRAAGRLRPGGDGRRVPSRHLTVRQKTVRGGVQRCRQSLRFRGRGGVPRRVSSSERISTALVPDAGGVRAVRRRAARYAAFNYSTGGCDVGPFYMLNDHTVYAVHFSVTDATNLTAGRTGGQRALHQRRRRGQLHRRARLLVEPTLSRWVQNARTPPSCPP